jgi:hypothetical protein
MPERGTFQEIKNVTAGGGSIMEGTWNIMRLMMVNGITADQARDAGDE